MMYVKKVKRWRSGPWRPRKGAYV